MNQHYFDVPFAFSGDVTAIPDPFATGGTVSFTEGWNYNYQRDLATDPAALPIDRSTMNWLFLQITTALQALQSETIPEFITAAQNGGNAIAYGPQARVLWSSTGNAPFAAYVNITGAANSNTPSASDPLGATTGWQVSCDPISTSAQAAAGTNNASIMTPLLVAQQTALRALLAGSTSQVFNVAPATAATHAVQYSQLAGVIGDRRNLLIDNSTTAGTTLAVTADMMITATALNGLLYKHNSINLTLNTANVGVNGMDTGAAPVSGDVAVYLIYNPTTSTLALLGTVSTGFQPEIYPGSNMPSGYTASALVSVWKTNASKNFILGFQRDRRVALPLTNMLSSPTVSTSLTVFYTGNAVPLAAKEIDVIVGAAESSAGSGVQFTIAGTVTGMDPIVSSSIVSGQTASDTTRGRCFVRVAGNLYYAMVNTNPGTYTAQACGYAF